MRKILFALLFSLAGISGSYAQSCNDPSGFLKSYGTIQIGDALVLGPDCQHVQDGGTGGNLPAGNLLYTPPGVGGTVQTQQAYDTRTVYPEDYGAKCDAVTDDAVALQRWINAAQSTQAPARYRNICLSNSGLNITSAIDFASTNPFAILRFPATVNPITVNTNQPVNLHDFQIQYLTPANTNTAGITITASSGENGASRIDNVNISQPNIGINFVASSEWVVSRNIISNFSVAGIIVQNTNIADSGDSTIQGNILLGSPSSSGAQCLLYTASGGLRAINNKCNGTLLANGFSLNLANAANTSDWIVLGNSIEGIAGTGNGILINRQGTTGNFSNVSITANVPLSGGKCVYIPTDANGVWINSVSVVGNTCVLLGAATDVAYSIDSVASVTFDGNAEVSNNAATKEFVVGSAATHCKIGYNSLKGTFAASTISSGACDAIAPQTSGTTTTVLHGNNAGFPTFGSVINADLGTGAIRQALTPFNALVLNAGNTIFTCGGASATENVAYCVAPFGGTFRNLNFLAAPAPGGAATIVVTLRVNGSDTAVTCTVTGAATGCTDTTHSVSITPGQTWSVKMVASAGAASLNPSGGLELDNP